MRVFIFGATAEEDPFVPAKTIARRVETENLVRALPAETCAASSCGRR